MPTFVKELMAGKDISELLPNLTPYAQSLVMQDLEEGCDIWEIINRRAAVLDDKYLGRTLSEVLQFKPEYWQPTIFELEEPEQIITYNEDGEEVIQTITQREIPNIWRCSLEN